MSVIAIPKLKISAIKILSAVRNRLAQLDVARKIPRSFCVGLSALDLCPKISVSIKDGQRTVVKQVEGGEWVLHVD